MFRNTTTRAALAICVSLFTLGGCTDQLKEKDAHIALIEDTNMRLTGELATCRNETAELARQRDDLDQRALAFSGQVDELTAQLNEIPEPVAPDGWQAVPGGAMIAIEGSVLFAPGKAALLPAGRAALDAITNAIQANYSNKDIFVFGHTDDTPIRKSGWKDNYELSAQRALTVVRHLRDRNLSPARLVACGAGEHRPVAPNANDTTRSKNRRVEIFAVDPINR